MGKAGIRVAIVAVIILGTVGYKLFFVDSDEVRNFNDRLVDMIERSNLRFEGLTDFIDQYTDGKKVNVEAMSPQRERLAESIRTDLKLLKRTTVPDDELCKNLHRTCVAYIRNSRDIADKYQEVFAYISQHNPGNAADFDVFLKPITPLLEKDEQLLEAAIAAQEKLVKKFGLKIE
ncbi:MAG: hypothetical protein QGH60_07725 [Phycisphaerae bacterium]|jgi:hypothetical protein|nr:hypothetical protein [Phycisphaerae bacterium]